MSIFSKFPNFLRMFKHQRDDDKFTFTRKQCNEIFEHLVVLDLYGPARTVEEQESLTKCLIRTDKRYSPSSKASSGEDSRPHWTSFL